MNPSFGLVCLLLIVAFPKGNAVEKYQLSSGQYIPVVGLGTSTIRLDDVISAIRSALSNGYRHIDTAFAYGNEAEIGKALRTYINDGGSRKDLFITSKLPAHGNRPESVEKYLKRSLKDLELDYVDMYLIHLPFGMQEADNLVAKEVNGKEVYEYVDHVALWKAMEAQVKAGRAKSIGLSNFNQSQILNIYNNAEIKPSNLQVESHAYLQQRDLRKFCKDHNIVMTAYAPLGSQSSRNYLYKGSDKDLPDLLEVALIKELAQKYKKRPAQILLRHSVQNGLVVIPKSSNVERQKENINLFDFELSDEDMKKIDALDQGEKGRVFDFLAFHANLDKNPQYPFSGSLPK